MTLLCGCNPSGRPVHVRCGFLIFFIHMANIVIVHYYLFSYPAVLLYLSLYLFLMYLLVDSNITILYIYRNMVVFNPKSE